MNEILLANVFFIITGSAVLVVAVFLCFVCYHIIKIVQIARAILEQVETGTEQFVENVQALRDHLANGTIFGKILTGVASVIRAMTATSRRTSSRKKKETPNEEHTEE